LFIGQGQGHLKVKVRESYAVKDLSEGTFCVNRNSIMQSMNVFNHTWQCVHSVINEWVC